MKQIYLDADDEITAIIGKLEHIENERIALIPPKRSTALQSVVNLKLLKKAALSRDNELVLITKDPVITNVASQLKLMTAPNLETEPSVPEAKDSDPIPSDTIDASEVSDKDYSKAGSAASSLEGDEGNDKKKPKAATKHQKVPNFEKFKKKILLGILLLLLLGAGLWWALFVAPNAQISIDGLTQDARANIEFRADPNAETNIEERVLTAEMEQESRTLSTTFEATGAETIGERATGSVTITNCTAQGDITVREGSRLTAANGLVYNATETVTVPESTVSGPASAPICNEDGTSQVPVEADDIGEDYNISPSDYTVEGYDSDEVYSTGSSSMEGGEEEEVSIVSESDIEEARQDLLEEERSSAEEDLRDRFDGSLYVIGASFEDEVNQTTSEPDAGEEAEEAELVVEVTYTMLAASRDEMEELLLAAYLEDREDVQEQLGLIEPGLDEANIDSIDGEFNFSLSASGVLGPNIDEDELKEEIGGMPFGEAIEVIEDIPNVRNVSINLEPFWVSSVPSNPDKVTIDFEIEGEEESDLDEEDDGDDSGD